MDKKVYLSQIESYVSDLIKEPCKFVEGEELKSKFMCIALFKESDNIDKFTLEFDENRDNKFKQYSNGEEKEVNHLVHFYVGEYKRDEDGELYIRYEDALNGVLLFKGLEEYGLGGLVKEEVLERIISL